MSTALPKPPRAARPWYRKKRYVIPLSVLVFLVAIGSIPSGDKNKDTKATSASGTAKATTTATKTVTATVEPSESATTPPPSPTPTPEPTTKPKPKPKPIVFFLVSRVVDGDTVELGNGKDVRIVGIDTPERGQCGYDTATANMERLVLNKKIRLGLSDEDHDRYGRLLRYVDAGKVDAGLSQIKAGLAIARYDSRDGYGFHPREPPYIKADRSSPSKTACPAKPKPKPKPSQQGAACAAGYSPCLPIVADLDCGDVDGPIYVTGSDPYGLDRENDGVGCE